MADFTTGIFTSVLLEDDGNGNLVDKGHTVNSKYLFDKNGDPVMDSTTGKPYIIPADMDFDQMVQRFIELYMNTPLTTAEILMQFKTGGALDLQRTGVDGAIYGGFVPDYTSAASLYFGAVSGALVVPANVAEIGGGILNFVNSLSNDSVITTGDYFNNPKNVENIRVGLEYYQTNISTNPIVDALVNAFDVIVDMVHNNLITPTTNLVVRIENMGNVLTATEKSVYESLGFVVYDPVSQTTPVYKDTTVITLTQSTTNNLVQYENYDATGIKTSTTVSTYNPDGTSAGVVTQALPSASDLITVPDTSSRSWVMDLFNQAAGATTSAIDKSVKGTSFERSTLQDLGTTAPSTSGSTPSYTLPFIPNNFFQNQDPNYGFIPGNNGGPSDYPSYYGGGGYVFPVILDLDGDGVEMISINDSRAWFDVTGDGTLHKTGWVGADDALLAFDENGDGKITTASEVMFASRTAITTDTDLEAIATEFDTNYDGILDASDAQFGTFRVWKDTNGNGETDAGELKTLTEMGMNSVNLVSTKVFRRN